MSDPIGPAQVHGYLERVQYPTDRQGLVKAAEQAGAGDDVLVVLGRLPDGTYNDPGEVSVALGAVVFGLRTAREHPEAGDHGIVVGPQDDESGDIDEV